MELYDSAPTEIMPSASVLRSELAPTERMIRLTDADVGVLLFHNADPWPLATLPPAERRGEAPQPANRSTRPPHPIVGFVVGGAVGFVVMVAMASLAALIAL